MKTLFLVFLSFAIFAMPVRAQEADADLLALVKQLQAHQEQIADNEAKTDAKVSDLAEAIRVARIFMSRAGGAHKLPKK